MDVEQVRTPAGGVWASRVRADRIRLLYESSYPAVFLSLAAATLLSLLLWPAVDHSAILLWLTVLAAASFVRIALFCAYFAKAPAGAALLAWERPYVVTLLASSAIWGFGCAWMMPRESLLHQVMTLFVLIGMAGAALAAYSAIRWLVIATLAVVLLPATIWLLATGERPAFIIGGGVILFLGSSLRATRVISDTLQQNFEMTYQLRLAKEDAERMASTDLLTGLPNRRAFLDLANAPFEYCRRNGLAAAAVVLDLDHFKQINDTYGHAAGDVSIRHIARLIQASLRKSDMCCRWGGEEFVVLLPGTPLEVAAGVAEKLRALIAATPVPSPGGDLSITASLGVAQDDMALEGLINRADQALLRAKREGRNRVACDDDGNVGHGGPPVA